MPEQLQQLISTLSTPFLKEHFFETLISLAISFVSFCITSKTNFLLLRLGKYFYTGFIFIVSFIITCFIHYIYTYLMDTIKKYIHHKKLETEQRQENLHIMWYKVDECSIPEKNILKYLLKNGNTAINLPSDYYYHEFVHINIFLNKTKSESDGTVKYYDMYNSEETDIIPIGTYYTKYRLTDYYYDLLKYSQEQYSRISNFE